MKAVIVAHGPAPPLAPLERWLDVSLVVAADGGADRVRAWRRRPDVLVGDLDSVSPETLAWCRDAGVEVVEHPRAKDDTDAELAVDLALERGADALLLAGGLGGRLDHTLGNLHVLLRVARRGVPAAAVDALGSTWIVTPELPLELDLPPGTQVSVLPLAGDAAGVSLAGFRWELEDAVLAAGDPLGVSNVVEQRGARVSLASGALVVTTAWAGP